MMPLEDFVQQFKPEYRAFITLPDGIKYMVRSVAMQDDVILMSLQSHILGPIKVTKFLRTGEVIGASYTALEIIP